MKKSITDLGVKTIGIDLGDKTHQVCMLNEGGQIVREVQVTNTLHALNQLLAPLPPALIAMEAGTHSPWVSSALEGGGHTTLVANPRKVKAISGNQRKSDKEDARLLAKLARVDPELLHPIRHRSAQTQADLALIKARHALIKARTGLINHCRGIVKSQGARLPACSAASFHKQLAAVPVELREALEPLLRAVEETTTKIYQLERKIEELAEAKYPQTAKLTPTVGVGRLTALAFMLVIEDPARFDKSRRVGSYLGLTPEKDQSGEQDKQLRISKAGDGYLRMLLVLCAQHILGPKSKECELRDWGLAICARGGKAAKKRAATAVARKLAVQLHRLWLSDEPYDPFYDSKKKARASGQSLEAVRERQGRESLALARQRKPAPAPGAKKGKSARRAAGPAVAARA